jgi:hypothetical protein
VSGPIAVDLRGLRLALGDENADQAGGIGVELVKPDDARLAPPLAGTAQP